MGSARLDNGAPGIPQLGSSNAARPAPLALPRHRRAHSPPSL